MLCEQIVLFSSISVAYFCLAVGLVLLVIYNNYMCSTHSLELQMK